MAKHPASGSPRMTARAASIEAKADVSSVLLHRTVWTSSKSSVVMLSGSHVLCAVPGEMLLCNSGHYNNQSSRCCGGGSGGGVSKGNVCRLVVAAEVTPAFKAVCKQ